MAASISRQAILDAAFTVFARRGFEQECVQEVATEAGVAKPTVYNHLSDNTACCASRSS